MKKPVTAIMLFVLFASLAYGQDTSMARKFLEKHATVKNLCGKPAPIFSARTMQEMPINISELKGKVVVLSVWTTTCGPCIREINAFKYFKNKYKGKNIEYIAIAPLDKQQDIKRFLANHTMVFKVWYAPSPNFVKDYLADEYPTNYVIDRNGMIRYSQVGYSKDGYKDISEVVQKCM
ncbi:TlpA disulfide reductase family protein [Mucilaginibacter sp. L3T2-6]|uniref:TlpA family protein disulfide reductase n=1 Tax=Mucilaginibacter sp. L3T2-6 TaxID=3062491 RepID=UPI002674FB6A|nr:TlpA disulfide reductase family protein [Mucilaginibacter sp. L3T2-6]MDO3641297.1 TlpA disulfide reductase family protein [Mucilaginibacter sp. L3T2-6]MDV6213943.1 TlpA disulfide reductase family protein [Mucilaginibacter sp. L3T2-6]